MENIPHFIMAYNCRPWSALINCDWHVLTSFRVSSNLNYQDEAKQERNILKKEAT